MNIFPISIRAIVLKATLKGIASTQDQISTGLNITADETVKASCNMLESVIRKTRGLSLGPNFRQALTPVGPRGHSIRKIRGSISGQCSDTSGDVRSSDDFSSIGYSFENLKAEKVAAPPNAGEGPSCSYTYPRSDPVDFNADSPDRQTPLKAEAIKDKRKLYSNQRGQFTTSSRGTRTHMTVTRSCKVTIQACIKGMEETRTFLCGPMDPRWKPYEFHRQICKASVSIYGEGARE